MIYSYSIYNEIPKEGLLKFFEKYKFDYFEIKNIKNVIGKKIIILNNKNTDAEIKELEILIGNDDDVLLMVPSNLSKDKKLSYRNFFSYPIKIGDFERKLKNFNYHKGLSFKDIVLRESNHIYNYKSNQKAHFTETEINIISALISKKKLKKESLKLDILKIKNTLNTKSLESHLSRIRKKLNEIDSKVKITSLDLDYININ